MFVVWKCFRVIGVYRTLELAKKVAERKASVPDGKEYHLEWELDADNDYTLWVNYKDSPPDDVIYITECVVDA